MRRQRYDWLMGIIALMVAVGSIIIISLAIRDCEEKRMHDLEFPEDSVQVVGTDTTYKMSPSRLQYIQDSLLYFEDGM